MERGQSLLEDFKRVSLDFGWMDLTSNLGKFECIFKDLVDFNVQGMKFNSNK